MKSRAAIAAEARARAAAHYWRCIQLPVHDTVLRALIRRGMAPWPNMPHHTLIVWGAR